MGEPMLIDVNCSVGFWPFQVFRQDTPAKLARHLAAEGVSRAFVSPIESVLYPDPHLFGRRLLGKLARQPALVPVPIVDPTLTNWQACLDAYAEAGHNRAVKIVPNYHRYELDAACVAPLVERLRKRPRTVLMIQMRVEDERQHYPLMKVPGVCVDAIIALARRYPDLRMLCLCPYLAEAAQLTAGADNVWVDTAFIEFMDTLAYALDRVPANRLVFGSHTPLLYTRANVLKLRHAGCAARHVRAVGSGNARRLLRL